MPEVYVAGGFPAVEASGVSVICEPLTEFEMLCTTAVTTPSTLVLIAATYLVAVVPPISQPQPFATGAKPPDWYTSVIEVRQALMAKITSDILARMV